MFKRKKLQLFTLLLAIVAFTVLSPTIAGAAPVQQKGIILVLNGIKGESRDAAYKDGIDILSASFGASAQVVSVGAGGPKAGKPSFSDLSLAKYGDAASLPLLKNLATGKPIQDGTLYFFDGRSDKPFLSIAMKNILVTSQQTSMNSGQEKPVESLTLNYAQATFTYNIFGPDGRVVNSFTLNIDIAKNVVS